MMYNSMFGALFALPFFIIWLGLIGMSIYAMVLFIRLAQRGIKVLDIYIAKNQNGYGNNQDQI